MNKTSHFRLASVYSALLSLSLLTPALSSHAQTTEKSSDWDIESSSFETSLSDGRATYYGTPGNPAVFTYDTMRIEGDPINITMEDGEITLLTTTGTPAVMQQTDEEGRIYTASASSIRYDNYAGLVTMEGEAEIVGPDGINFNACYIEYIIDTNSVRARACSPDDRVNMSIEQEDSE